jgi:hypothetical protein
MIFAAMNLLALAFHTVCDSIDELWGSARQAKKARRRFFEHFQSITAYLVSPLGNLPKKASSLRNRPPDVAAQIAM